MVPVGGQEFMVDIIVALGRDLLFVKGLVALIFQSGHIGVELGRGGVLNDPHFGFGAGVASAEIATAIIGHPAGGGSPGVRGNRNTANRNRSRTLWHCFGSIYSPCPQYRHCREDRKEQCK